MRFGWSGNISQVQEQPNHGHYAHQSVRDDTLNFYHHIAQLHHFQSPKNPSAKKRLLEFKQQCCILCITHDQDQLVEEKFKSLADKKVKTFAFSTNYTTSSLFKQNFKNCVLNSRLIKKMFFFRKCKQCQQQLWILISRANLLRDKKFPLVSDSGFPANGITVVLSHKSIR